MALQRNDEIVEIRDWRLDEQFPVYPEGSREKRAIFCPDPAPFQFLVPNHRYLFKLSNPNFPAQFWAEVVAYRFGQMIGVEVPPAFVAVDSRTDACAALIEWFYGHPLSEQGQARYVPGSNFMIRLYPGYDQKKGKQHNVQAIIAVMRALDQASQRASHSLPHWSRVFTFDALIGDTDRHQDNWGILVYGTRDAPGSDRFSPAFDNGTSLGHEVLETNIQKFADAGYLERYISRGRHHARWAEGDAKRCFHDELLVKWVERFPTQKQVIERCLRFDMNRVAADLRQLITFQVAEPLTAARCEMMISLIRARRRRLLLALGLPL